jgi:ADP-heptose:LPS heptosyltransferase
MKKIGILRALNLGDLLTSVPALRALRYKYRRAEISLISLPWANTFVDRYKIYIDRFIEFPGFPGLPEQTINTKAIVDFIREIRKENFDLVIQMQGNGVITNALVDIFGAKLNAGFCIERSKKKDWLLFTVKEDTNEVLKMTQLMEFLGISVTNYDLELPLFYKEYLEFGNLRKKYNLGKKPYIVIHTGSRDPGKRFGKLNFANIANFFIELGFEIVFTGTNIEEKIVTDILQIIRKPAINLVGKTSLGAVALLIKNSALLVTNDTGISHVASAVKARSVVIFTHQENVKRWAPLDNTKHIAISPESNTEMLRLVLRHCLTQLYRNQKLIKVLSKYQFRD